MITPGKGSFAYSGSRFPLFFLSRFRHFAMSKRSPFWFMQPKKQFLHAEGEGKIHVEESFPKSYTERNFIFDHDCGKQATASIKLTGSSPRKPDIPRSFAKSYYYDLERRSRTSDEAPEVSGNMGIKTKDDCLISSERKYGMDSHKSMYFDRGGIAAYDKKTTSNSIKSSYSFHDSLLNHGKTPEHFNFPSVYFENNRESPGITERLQSKINAPGASHGGPVKTDSSVIPNFNIEAGDSPDALDSRNVEKALPRVDETKNIPLFSLKKNPSRQTNQRSGIQKPYRTSPLANARGTGVPENKFPLFQEEIPVNPFTPNTMDTVNQANLEGEMWIDTLSLQEWMDSYLEALLANNASGMRFLE